MGAHTLGCSRLRGTDRPAHSPPPENARRSRSFRRLRHLRGRSNPPPPARPPAPFQGDVWYCYDADQLFSPMSFVPVIHTRGLLPRDPAIMAGGFPSAPLSNWSTAMYLSYDMGMTCVACSVWTRAQSAV